MLDRKGFLWYDMYIKILNEEVERLKGNISEEVVIEKPEEKPEQGS